MPDKQSVPRIMQNFKFLGVIWNIQQMLAAIFDPEKLKSSRSNVSRLLYLVIPRDWSADGGRREMLMIFIVSILRTFILNSSTLLSKRLVTFVYNKDRQGFKRFIPLAIAITVLGSLLKSIDSASRERLQQLWRSKLVHILHEKYFQMNNYYQLPNSGNVKTIIDAPQRITREVASVSSRLVNVIVGVVAAMPPLLWFTYRMYKQDRRLFMVPHVVLVLAFEVAQRVFPKNIGISYKKLNEDFSVYNSSVARAVEHSETIAALHGQEREKLILRDKYSTWCDTLSRLQLTCAKFNLTFSLAYQSCIRGLLIFLVCQPIFKMKDFRKKMAAGRMGIEVMYEMIIPNGQLLTVSAQVVQMEGTSKRVVELLDDLSRLIENNEAQSETQFKKGDRIAFKDVTVRPPGGDVLVENLNFEVKPGGALLLTGHNGAGKSSIFRCLGGLWTAEGVITKPGNGTGLHNEVYYLPQKPYNVVGTIRDQLTYPDCPDQVGLTNTQLKELLDMVELGHLMSYVDVVVRNWEERLSLGEQQRLAMARLFFHQPTFAILDECTSAVSHSMEELLYHECRRLGIAYITICHRPALEQFHSQNLHLVGGGSSQWVLRDLPPVTTQPRSRHVDPQVRRNSVVRCAKRVGPRSFWARLFGILRVMVPGSGKKVLILGAFILMRTSMLEILARLDGKMMSAFAEGRSRLRMFGWCLLYMAHESNQAILSEFLDWLRYSVGLKWNQSLTTYLTNGLFQGNRLYYARHFLDIDADQRMTGEVHRFTEKVASIISRAVQPTIDVVWFSYRLKSLSGNILLVHLYSMVVAGLLALVRPDQEDLTRRESELESTFKFIHDRVYTQGESIAFFGGDAREREIADEHYKELSEHLLKMARVNAQYKFFYNALHRDSDKGNPTRLMCMPELVSLHLRMDIAEQSQRQVVGANQYADVLTGQLIKSCGNLFSLYEDISKIRGSVTRLGELVEAVQLTELDEGEATVTIDPNRVALEDITLETPSGQVLASKISLELQTLESLMVTGPNGCGKTSFFRVLAGLWKSPFGRITRPDSRDLQLVPQRVYLVQGTLLDQVTYPREAGSQDEAGALEALTKLNIGYLVERWGWNTTKRWEATLSLGEQQRIGIARLIFSKPNFAVLDECTSAVSMDAENMIYETMHELGITCITLSQRLALHQYHSRELMLGEDWKLRTVLPEHAT